MSRSEKQIIPQTWQWVCHFGVQLASFSNSVQGTTCVHNCHVQSVFGQFIRMDSCEHAVKVNSPVH